MKKNFLIYLLVFLILVMPAVSLAANIVLVPCNNTPDPATGVIAQPCDWNALMKLVNTIINFVLYFMAIPIAAIMFAYAGFELVSSGGSSEKRGMAKKVFTNAVFGLVLAAAAWLIVKLVLKILGWDGAFIGFPLS
jgi:amino acid transporter